MKKMKKITAFIAVLCMAVMMVPAMVFAADAELRFSDPSTTVGAAFEVTARLTSDSNVDSAEAVLTYDSTSLKFVSGDGAVDNGGQIQLTGNGGGTASELSWTLHFQALKEGTAKIEISSASGTSSDGTAMDVTKGSSTVTIGAGDPSLISDTTAGAATGTVSGAGGQVEVNGQTYTISNDFSDAIIPDGFTRTQTTYEGQTCEAAQQESSGKFVLYLTSQAGESDFFLYDPEDGSLAPFVQINVAPDRFIVLLDKDKSSEVPSGFEKTSITVEGKEFPAWQNTDNSEYYAVYALNSDGKEAFYQYDTVDGTYQRHTLEASATKEEGPTSFIGKALDIIKNNLDKVLIAVWAVFLLMLIILIVLAVKLSHRNAELDDLYDEYGIDDEEEEEVPAAKAKKQKEPKVKDKKDKKKKKVDEDDFYDLEDDDYASDDDYDDYELEEDDYDFEDVEDEEDEIEDLDALLEERGKKPAKRRGHAEEDDTFKMDIIDLD